MMLTTLLFVSFLLTPSQALRTSRRASASMPTSSARCRPWRRRAGSTPSIAGGTPCAASRLAPLLHHLLLLYLLLRRSLLQVQLLCAAATYSRCCCGRSCHHWRATVPAAAADSCCCCTLLLRCSADCIKTSLSWFRSLPQGPCVKVFAPGTDIYSACGGSNRCSSVSDTSYTWASGTSMAAPHVAGVAALFLARNPLATPAQVTDAIVRSATVGRINGPTLPGTPNLLLFSGLTPFVAVATAAGGPPGSGGYGGGGGGDVVRSASAEDEGAQHTSTSSSSSSESSSSSDEHTDQSADEDDANLLSHMATSTGNNGGGGGGGGGGGSLHPGSMLWGGWWGSAGSDESQNGSGNSGGAGAGGGGVESSAYPKVSLQVAAAGPASGDGGAPLHSESSRWSWGQSQTVRAGGGYCAISLLRLLQTLSVLQRPPTTTAAAAGERP